MNRYWIAVYPSWFAFEFAHFDHDGWRGWRVYARLGRCDHRNVRAYFGRRFGRFVWRSWRHIGKHVDAARATVACSLRPRTRRGRLMSEATAFRVYAADELGRDGYPPEWHATIKHAVREQAGYRCVRCQHPYRNGEHESGEWSACDGRCLHGPPVRVRVDDPAMPGEYPDLDRHEGPIGPLTTSIHCPIEAHWRILTVHHLDGDKANCRWWNLAALCQRCHLTIQGRVVMARIWPWEHSDWFKPYVAGYYASVYLAEELERADVEARLDELLALELVA